MARSRSSLPEVIELSTDAEIQGLGMATITDIGAENVYVAKAGRRYCFKPGNTDHFAEGDVDFTGVWVFGSPVAA